jgi:hypothetical protein
MVGSVYVCLNTSCMGVVEPAEPSVVTDRLFRVVLFSESMVRLMERAGDAPSSWRLPHERSPVRLVVARDIVTTESVPRHLGLEYVVEVAAPDIEEAAEQAHRFAETTAVTLSAAGRSPVGRVHVRLAYEITPGISQRDFRQWYWDIPLPEGKRPVSRRAFGALRTRIDELDTAETRRVVWRVLMSLSWYRQAAHEDDALFRFLKLWIAFEAVGPLLADHYRCEESRGFQGLRALAEESGIGSEELGTGSEFITNVLRLRRELFHARRVTSDDLRATAETVLEPLEQALARAWEVLLGIDSGTLPDQSVIPYRLHLKVFAVLHQANVDTWSERVHPALVLKAFEAKPVVAEGDPRDVTFTIQSTHTVTGVEAAQLTRMEIRGPTGGTLKMEQADATPIVEQDSETEPDSTDGPSAEADSPDEPS